jgi:non-ribosomal peptide synthetase component F
VAIGTSVANRTHEESEGVIGFFVNELVIRTEMSGSPTFADIVRRVRDTVLDASLHQDVPFDQVVDRVAPSRDPSRSPLFQILFVWQHQPVAAMELGAVTGRYESAGLAASKFDLTINLRADGDAIAGALIYNRALFDAATIERLGSWFTQLLDRACAAPDEPILLDWLKPSAAMSRLAAAFSAEDVG